MKIITEIKVIETDQEFYEIERHVANQNATFVEFDDEVLPVEVVRELIKGRRFIDRSRGIDIFLGCSHEVGVILQLQYDAFGNLIKDVDKLRSEKAELTSRLNKVLQTGFFTRLKYLFTGIK